MIDKYYEKFGTRLDALDKLLDVIPSDVLKKPNTMLIAISEGGLVMANEIIKRYALPLDFLFTEPILAPKNPECEVAIVSESMDISINEALVESFDITYDFIYGEAQRRYEEKILPNIYRFRKGEIIRSLSKKNIIIIDDGVETGLTMRVALKTCTKKLASTITIATPVISADALEMLDDNADVIYSVYSPKHFVNTKYYYEEYDKIDSNVVVDILNKALLQNNTKQGTK